MSFNAAKRHPEKWICQCISQQHKVFAILANISNFEFQSRFMHTIGFKLQ
jgi:hypothetical protein